MGKVIGIDLGTTNSLVTVWENGECKLIPNAFGEYLTPSVVSVDDDGTVYVGKVANERLQSHPERTVAFFKRYMGTGKKYQLGDKTFLPEELSALVLKKLREDAEKYLGEPVEEAVISVPAYFNDMSRNATKRAGMLAGLKVDRIINEPSAASLACQHMQNETDATMLVFDFGGGTLDVSLVECFDNVIEILAVSGDNRLGGQDFDEKLANHFIKKMGKEKEYLSEAAYMAVRASAEKCKRELTELKSAVMEVTCPEITGKLTVTRKEMVDICAEIFTRMEKPVRRVLADGQIRAEDLDYVILVGGSCKMKIVQQYLSYLFQRKDLVVLNPDYMIAMGTGTYAGIKERQEDIKDMILTDICPFSLGVDIANHNNPGKNLMSFIIQRNSPLPISRVERYTTSYDNQKRVEFNVYQGEGMYAVDNLKLGSMEMDVPARKKGEVVIQMRFTYDLNGVLEVNAEVPMTGEKKRLVIVNKDLHLSEEEIEKKLKGLEALKINPQETEENQFVLALAERLYCQSSGSLREDIGNRMNYFEYVLSKQEPYRIQKARKHMLVFLTYIEGMLGDNVSWNPENLQNTDWYQDEDDEDMENDFRQWYDEED
ncbi:MAG: molecular chaperone HscC [Lachnospiraceae bacterium]|nr:molecular chaperone HscC [Lachnospiraceae bacterium]